ncbi:hypothetical protein QZM03_11680 [Burkholderia multivorans]|nr:hypothetical protein [Burkholderia multivorans]
MTKLFLLMWLADVAKSIAVIGTVCLLAFFIGLIFGKLVEVVEGRKMNAWKFCRWLLIPIAVAALFPNQRTIYALVVADAGEQVADTQLGQKAMRALDAILDQITKKAKE